MGNKCVFGYLIVKSENKCSYFGVPFIGGFTMVCTLKPPNTGHVGD